MRSTVATSEGWKRIQATFAPPLPTQVLTLKLAFTGRLWIDALQLERNTVATDLFGNPLAAGSELAGHMTYLAAAGSAADLLARLR